MRGARFPLALAVVALAGCGGSAKHAATTTAAPVAKPAPFAGTVARTIAARTARFEQVTEINAGGSPLEASETGNVSFKLPRRAHIYKQLPAAAFRARSIVIGPVVYANTNVQAALADPVGSAVDEARHEPPDPRRAREPGGRARAQRRPGLSRRRRGAATSRRRLRPADAVSRRRSIPRCSHARLPAGVRALVMQSVRSGLSEQAVRGAVLAGSAGPRSPRASSPTRPRRARRSRSRRVPRSSGHGSTSPCRPRAKSRTSRRAS